MTQINDIITDEIGSVYAETATWCNENNAMLEEIEPIEKEVEEEYTEIDDEGHEVHKTRTVIKQYRQFKIISIPVHDPTLEEQKEKRAQAYAVEVDPVTAHIQRERDEAKPDEEKIAALITERAQKVADIQARFPYPEDSCE